VRTLLFHEQPDEVLTELADTPTRVHLYNRLNETLASFAASPSDARWRQRTFRGPTARGFTVRCGVEDWLIMWVPHGESEIAILRIRPE
jgi:hypothetical protein